MKEQARRESDLIVQEAHAEGRRVMREITSEKLRLEEDVRRIRALLRTALELVDEQPPRAEPQPSEDGKPSAAGPQPVEESTDSSIRQVAG
jgi:hypothetical protein